MLLVLGFCDLFGRCLLLIFFIIGATISIILNINMHVAIILSAVTTVAYTFTGGLWAVAYTDVVQLVCIVIGMVRLLL